MVSAPREKGLGDTCAVRCADESFAYVVVDGTSLSIVDRRGTKEIGALGGMLNRGRGVKVISAIAFSRDGELLGGSAFFGNTVVWDLRRLRRTLAEMNLDW